MEFDHNAVAVSAVSARLSRTQPKTPVKLGVIRTPKHGFYRSGGVVRSNRPQPRHRSVSDSDALTSAQLSVLPKIAVKRCQTERSRMKTQVSVRRCVLTSAHDSTVLQRYRAGLSDFTEQNQNTEQSSKVSVIECAIAPHNVRRCQAEKGVGI